MKLAISNKHLQVDKANATVVAVTAIAAAVTVFCLVGSKALLDQRSFQSRVIEKKQAALDQLKENSEATTTLVTAYQEFVSAPENVIKGNPSGDGERDGDNASIVLDALPSKYDFPALATSIEKILTNLSVEIQSITGQDDEINQNSLESDVTEPVIVPFEFTVGGNYQALQDLIVQLQRSIRPIEATEISFSSSGEDINLDFSGFTYYKPSVGVEITEETINQ